MCTMTCPCNEVKPTKRANLKFPATLPEIACPDHATEWPQVLHITGTPATGCDLLEWPGANRSRGRYIVRRYADHRITDRATTDSLRDAEALFYHLSTPLPTDHDPDQSGAFLGSAE